MSSRPTSPIQQPTARSWPVSPRSSAQLTTTMPWPSARRSTRSATRLSGPSRCSAALSDRADESCAFARTTRRCARSSTSSRRGRRARYEEDAGAALMAQQANTDRATLFTGASGSSSGPHSRFARSGNAPAESPFTLPARPRPGAPTTGDLRTDFALREDDFIKSTGGMLDQYIAQGQAVLMNLGCVRRGRVGADEQEPTRHAQRHATTAALGRSHARPVPRDDQVRVLALIAD